MISNLAKLSRITKFREHINNSISDNNFETEVEIITLIFHSSSKIDFCEK